MKQPVFSPQEKGILHQLVDKLPRLPHVGFDKEEILDEMGWKGYPPGELEANWRKICGVILKSRRAVELRQPDMPIIRYGGIGGKSGYQLVGLTGHDGTFLLFPILSCEENTGAAD